MSDARSIAEGQHLHFDCVSGAAGDMTLGALFDLGVPAQVARDAVAATGLDAGRIEISRVVKSGIAATDVKVAVHHHGHHDGPHHHGYSYADIRQQLEGSSLEPRAVRLAQAIFARLARAEAKLHGTEVDAVHFHEVGAIDSIVDVVGTAAAIAWLSPASVSCPSVAMGHGEVRCAHGALPVPSPAAVEIMREAGGIVEGGGVARELCTPTGAAILAEVVTSWGPCPPMAPVAIGYGAGDIDLPDRPNVLRAIVGKPSSRPDPDVVVIEANLDDMSAEQASFLAEALFDRGALDVWWTPIVMKKARPAFQLGVIAPVHKLDELADLILTDSTSLGIRHYRSARRVLERECVEVDTEFGRVAVVVASRGGRVLRAVPEYEPCGAAAREHGVPLREVMAAAERAYWSARR